MEADDTVEPGQSEALRPARALLRGVATLLDFTGALARRSQTQSVDEDMAIAWQEVLGAARPPSSTPSDKFSVLTAASSLETSRPEEGPPGHLLSGDPAKPMPPPVGQGELFPDYREDVGFRGPIACAAAGITYRQLDYWARTGLVEPSVRLAGGSGSQRLYGFRDIFALKIVKRLLDTGISLKDVRAAIDMLRELAVDDLAQVTLISDGESVYLCRSPDEVVDLLQGGQGVFGIALGRVWQEVEGTLADLPQERGATAVPGDQPAQRPGLRRTPAAADPLAQPDKSLGRDESAEGKRGKRAG
jgi:DNA-binding transcriptional MerR regulator